MSIKTWQERWETRGVYKDAAMRAEIDELRAALQERDAEIERLHAAMAGLQDMESSAQQKLAAQSKALEQALEALQSLFSFKVDDTRGERCSSAITAIQKVLHG